MRESNNVFALEKILDSNNVSAARLSCGRRRAPPWRRSAAARFAVRAARARGSAASAATRVLCSAPRSIHAARACGGKRATRRTDESGGASAAKGLQCAHTRRATTANAALKRVGSYGQTCTASALPDAGRCSGRERPGERRCALEWY